MLKLKISNQIRLFQASGFIALMLIFLAIFDLYLKPGFMMQITSQLLMLCGS